MDRGSFGDNKGVSGSDEVEIEDKKFSFRIRWNNCRCDDECVLIIIVEKGKVKRMIISCSETIKIVY